MEESTSIQWVKKTNKIFAIWSNFGAEEWAIIFILLLQNVYIQLCIRHKKKVLFSLKILNIAADKSGERADPDQTAPSMVT